MAVSGINWLVGYPKSGTTWVRAFLAAYLDGLDEVDPNKLSTIGTSDSHVMFWCPHVAKPIDYVELAEMSIFRPAAMFGLLQSWAATGHWFNPIVKTHVANLRITGIDLFPRALTSRALYIVRDPRDVAISSTRYFGGTYDDAVDRLGNDDHVIGADTIVQPIRSWSSHVHSWLDAQAKGAYPVGFVAYEDLLDNPVDKFTGIIEFMGWEVDEQRVVKAVEAASFDKLKDAEQRLGMYENRSKTGLPFFGEGRRGTHKDKLTAAQIERIETDHMAMMVRLGYLGGNE